MSKSREQDHTLEIVAGVGLFLGALFISQLAFSEPIAKRIGVRDHWTCQGCGRAFRDGWTVDAAHAPEHHCKDDPIYDTEEAGDIRCLDCHQHQHEEGTCLGPDGDKAAVWYLEKRDRVTRRWHQENDPKHV